MMSDLVWYMGIDPGQNGAMAFYCPRPERKLIVHDFVTVKGLSSENQYHVSESKREIAITETANLIRDHAYKFGDIKLVYLETPHSLPNDGHVGAFRFGKACGILDGILGTLGLKVIPAKPSVWKPHLKVKTKQDSINKAIEIFGDIPNVSRYFDRKKDHDRAEAALLAWSCYKIFGGGK